MRSWIATFIALVVLAIPVVSLLGCGNGHKEQAKYEIGDPDMPAPPADGDGGDEDDDVE